MENNKAPVARFKAGSVVAAVWDNNVSVNGNVRSIKKVTVEHRYRDRGGNWKSTNSFSRDQIALVKHCLDKAFEFMLQSQDTQSSTPNRESI